MGTDELDGVVGKVIGLIEVETEKESDSITSISLPLAVKTELDRLKIITREPYYQVVQRLITFFNNNSKPTLKTPKK
jgi:hypothetical protein